MASLVLCLTGWAGKTPQQRPAAAEDQLEVLPFFPPILSKRREKSSMFARLLSRLLRVWKSKPFMETLRPLGVFAHRLGERTGILAAVCLHYFLGDKEIKRRGGGELIFYLGVCRAVMGQRSSSCQYALPF